MSDYHIKKLRTLGKRYARATTKAHIVALNALATEFGFKHWKALTDAAKSGWQINDEDIARAEAFVREAGGKTQEGAPQRGAIFFSEPASEEGELCGHQYQIRDSLGDVFISGTGWDLRIPEAPYKTPVFEIDERYSETSPAKNSDFQAELLKIAQERSTRIRAQMAVDWPRRSTKADHDGIARDPLSGAEAVTWYCHSCDAQITGEQVAENFWHCPNCGTHPLNLHAEPFDEQFPGEQAQTPNPELRMKAEVRLVEPRLMLHVDEETVSTLIRCALLEDATSVNERLGAMRAKISLIDKEVVWITFDELLWPEDKETTSALAVAAKLGFEVELEVSLFSEPFAWPDLGNLTSDTTKFVEVLTEAYEEHGVIKR